MTDIESSIQRNIQGRTAGRKINSATLARLASEETGRSISRADVRNAVFYLRQNGTMAICSSTDGYWEAQSKEEILDVVRRLTNRVENQMKSIKGLTDYLQAQTAQQRLL